MSANAEYSRRWQIRGIDAQGRKLAFPVSAFDHAGAVKAAKAKAPVGSRIDDVVLVEPRKIRFV